MVRFLQNSRLVKIGICVVTILLLFYRSDVMAQVQKKVILSTPVGTVAGYLEHVPDEYTSNPSKSYPLLLFIHGIGEVGTGSDADLNKLYRNGPPNLLYNGKFPSSFTVGGQTHKFIVISPQFNRSWPNQTVIMNFIEYLKTKYRIDVSRIYLTGLSMGGGVVWNTAGASTTNAFSFAAIAPICGASGANRSVANVMASQNLPIWAFHNDGDPSVDVRNTIGYVNYFNEYTPKAVPQAKMTIWQSTSHNAWGKAYDPSYKENNMNLYEWMLSYKRTGSPNPTPPNQLPVANAGPDQTITLPTTSVSIDGTGSKDPDGNIVSHAWTQVGGPVSAKFGNAWISKTTISGISQPGTYTFRLTIKDNMGATATDDLVIIVKSGSSPLAPVANAGPDQTITQPASSVTVTSQSSDPDGTIKSNYWSQTAGPTTASLVNQWGASTQVNNLTVAGTYTFQLRVTDDNNNSATDWVNIVVKASTTTSTPPVVSAGNNQTITLPKNSVTLTGTSTTATGTIQSNYWSQISGPTAATFFTTQWLPSVNVGNLTKPGQYVFEFKSTNSSNLSATSRVTITVLESVTQNKQAPVVTAGQDQSIKLPASTATLTGSAKDTDGTIMHHYWSQLDGPVTVRFATTQWLPSVSLANLTISGTYRFVLRVMDNDNQYAYDTVSVLVIPSTETTPPTTALPVADAGEDFEIVVELAGSTAITSSTTEIYTYLDGTGSYSPIGTIDQFYWKQISGPNTVSWGNAWYHKPKVMDLDFGDYEFVLRVMDSNKQYAYDTVKVSVRLKSLFPPPPAQTIGLIANAGADISIPSTQTSVILNGSGSSSTGGSITNYFWRYISGPSVFLKDTWRATPTLTNFSGPGTYSIELTVTDANQNKAYDTVNVIVWNAQSTSLPSVAAAMESSTGSSNIVENKLVVYPNPVQAQATIRLTAAENGKAVLLIYNMNGAVVYQESFEKSGKDWTKSVNLSNLGRGTYIMKIQVGKSTLQQKLIKL